ncbi:amidohydrolase family protein [Jiangella mangrovi]|uniref:N-acyl-D-amino-acid deacylase n=1 Tax=Jiangella mangrovi TaxID=1524084 RepID=A0A7W9GUD3_9ACTN|nr:N-acyl-D-amino-acid deacylase [Jiangella mangrovi]
MRSSDQVVLVTGGFVADGSGREPYRADVVVRSGRIAAVVAPGAAGDTTDAEVVDCTGRLVLPGFVDVHSHADGAVFAPDVQFALLRQGVTTVVAGQDGVSYAPGDGAYATEYFGGLLGRHPHYRGGGVGALLAGYDGRVPVRVASLVPHGTVRAEVLGRADRAPTPAELAAMADLVATGLAEGACGLSSGLDYVPGRFAGTEELAALCRPVAAAGRLYVTHMRGGYEDNAAAGVAEVREICLASGVRGHISHYHGPGAALVALLDEARAAGADLTFDAYPYRAGCTLLSMPVLPPDLLDRPVPDILAVLGDDGVRARLLASPVSRDWARRTTVAHAGTGEYAWAEGLTLTAAADRHGGDVQAFVLDLLIGSRLEATVVMHLPPGRSVDELALLVRDERHTVGSDGVYVGTHPHPRGWGSFARVLARHVRDRGDLTWGQAAVHLAARPAQRFGLATVGRIAPGRHADLVVLDPDRLDDPADYATPRTPARGIDDVLVAGVGVLAGGALTGAFPGGGLRAGAS